MKTAINAIAFQAGWFVCVLLQGWWAWGYVVVYLTIHLLLLGGVGEIKFITLAALIGIGVDSILTWQGVFRFGSELPFSPPWLMALWFLFASTFNHALLWLRKYRLATVIFGALGGCTSYLAGHKLGAVFFPLPLVNTVIVIALIWAILFPALQALADYLDQQQSRRGLKS